MCLDDKEIYMGQVINFYTSLARNEGFFFKVGVLRNHRLDVSPRLSPNPSLLSKVMYANAVKGMVLAKENGIRGERTNVVLG